jgi:hypothetical protein
LKHFIPPAPTEEPSCTTAPPWGWGGCNAIEPRAIVGGGGIEFLFYFIFFLKHFIPPPPAPMEEPSCTTAPPWGWGGCNATEAQAIVREGGIEFYFFILFFLETFHPPRPHGGAVVHDGSSVGAGGLQRDRATNQRT